ncbi:hypothetical protein HPB47_022292 [Ixodes persulcatus]|uniref:Uncharacterized protein n=1 Tax=Ixodes persulcatus TaxID=34615 RepID=A0AC60QCH3_IXOPE|nr:hypothetical protein HPB47_022292 [Ixodes persulcatus]
MAKLSTYTALPAPRLSRLTVILRPCQPCRILDEPYIKLDEALSSHLRTSLALVQGTRTPNFTTRFLTHSNQLALDVYDPAVRDAFLKIKSLPIRGKEAPFQAYEATGEGQIRGIIQNAGCLTQEQLMASLHCRKCRILNARPLGDNGTALVTFESTRLPYRIGLRSFTVRVLPYKPKVAVRTTCHRMGHVKERCPNTDNARCSICGLKKHDGDASCPNATPKCRNCGGPHLATDKGCLKRTQLNKKIARRRRPKAPRRIETTVDNQGQPIHAGKRTGASRNNTDTTTPLVPGSAGDPRRLRLIATPTSTSFYTGPHTSAQESTATAAERKLTFADAVRMANADTATQTINTTQRRGSKLAQESRTPCIPEPAAQVSEETQTETPVRISASTTPSIQITLEAQLERRIAQLEQRVMEYVQRTIDRAIETCVRTLMDRLMLSSTSPFGTSITQPAPAASMVILCGDFNARHTAWGYDKCSPRERKVMADTQNYHLSLINTPDDPTRIGQSIRQADTTPDLTWASHPRSVTWHLHEDLMGSDHFPIVIKIKIRRTLGYAIGARTATRPAFLTHWDKYRKLLEETSPSGDIAHLTGQILDAKQQATRRIQVPYDHPDPDKCLLTLWNRRLRLLAKYRKSGRRRSIKRKLRITQQIIEDYTTALAPERWMTLCEGFNGNTSTPRVTITIPSRANQDLQWGQTRAGRSILAKLGYPVHDLPELPQQTPPWEHIVLTDGTPLPQRIQSTGRRLPLKRRHLKYIRSLDDCTHLITAALVYATAWCNCNTEAQARHLHTTTTPPLSTQAELQAITDYARDALLTAKEDAPVTHIIYTDSQAAHQICSDTKYTGPTLYELKVAVSSLRASGHQFIIRWVPAHCGIPGNEKAHRLARAHLLSALAKGPSSSSSLGNPSQEIANPWHDLRSTKAQRAAYLSMAANPLSIPKIPSQHFSRREAVMIRQIQTGTLLTPHLLQRFRGNDGAGSSTASGICKNCNSKADLVHLMWSCPLYNLPRQRALDLITNAPVPASLNAWACPDTTISPKHALELWEALLTFIRDPTAPPVGDRLLPATAKRIRPPPPSSTKALKP